MGFFLAFILILVSFPSGGFNSAHVKCVSECGVAEERETVCLSTCPLPLSLISVLGLETENVILVNTLEKSVLVESPLGSPKTVKP